ncbi:spermatogenesis-associated protein 20 isoform X2 [Astyanax mexicanus]|uniref:spermatogenesis-associated protein 20 isoform X2 n=1 Tax=Astyanax mexicanus TaxID=7994 RepID=UPI0020CB6844|nr:spermatogenesis-associated protein 20 isoform X2 [Astyanax mexicanus]
MLRLLWTRSPSSSRRFGPSRLLSGAFSRKDRARTRTLFNRQGSEPTPTQHFDSYPRLLNFRSSQHSSSFRAPEAACFSMASGSDGQESLSPPKHTNRLRKERSPYLLQHAHNPVDWFPWGQEAFDKAKSEDKPIFLSVGYSTCHWCHVMERESFEDEEIGKILSDNFVCIKVDREERPDVDKVYMTFVQATSGGGGWPMSVWLTPSLRPFIGGTYFPPRDSSRRPGFKTILLRIMEQWQNNREALESSGERVVEALRKGTSISASPGESLPSGPDVANRCFQQLAHSYEEEYGGFRDAPKFPTPVNLLFLMSFWTVNRSSAEGAEALQMALHTLRMMALGGIHDHVAQGFHRYSTDSSWHVPHFEKMLYDQAQLAVAYITAYQVSGERLFADVALDVLQYVSRDLSHKSGGFYSAEDADSLPTPESAEKREGAFCVWTAGEVRDLLSETVEGATGGATQADIFMHHYGVKDQGNVEPEQDPHGELQGQNVLIVRYSVELTAARFGLSVDRLTEVLASARAKLAEVRRERPPPHLDSKMLASWNGLMLSGFARVGAVLGDKALLQRAEQAAQFLQEHLWDKEGQRILHSCYRGDDMEMEQTASPIAGFLDDYAFVVCGLLDLFEATQTVQWLKWAEDLQNMQDQLFWDAQGSGYFSSDPSDPTLLLSLKQDRLQL